MVSVSLCMIVKNEEDVLERCLDSVSGLVDEIIVVDTGSTDNTKEAAARFTDRIFDFPWQDDFAAARNEAFSHATMDYCMWLDADDVIQDSERQKLIKLKEELEPDVLAVMMKYATSFDSAGRPAFLFDRERLVRRDAGLMWEGRVHEVIDVQKGLKGGPGGTAGGRGADHRDGYLLAEDPPAYRRSEGPSENSALCPVHRASGLLVLWGS